jgi:type I restriction enzyme S subunit
MFLRSQNIQMNRLQLEDVACLPEEVHSSMERTHVRFGDVLLNITGASIGRVAWYDLKDQAANVNQHVCIIRLRETATPEYVSVFLSMPYGQMLINGAQTGATRQGLNHDSVRRISLPLPSIAEQQSFAASLLKLRNNSEKRVQSSFNIENLFQTMLYRAFTGELTAGWRTAHMKELLVEMELQSKALGKLEEAA